MTSNSPIKSNSYESFGEIDKRLFVSSLEKGFRVLKAFYESSDDVSLTEVAQFTGLGRSAAQRLLYTFRVLGYVEQDLRTRRYRLTARVLDSSYAFLRNNRLKEIAFPYLLDANIHCEETVNLTELIDTDIIYVARFPSRWIISANIVIGKRLPAFSTAPGLVMLAYMPPECAHDILERSDIRALTPYTCTNMDEIKQSIVDIRQRGYTIANQQTYVGDMSVAAPVLDDAGQAAAAVNISVSTARWDTDRVTKELVPLVIETAQAISKALR